MASTVLLLSKLSKLVKNSKNVSGKCKCKKKLTLEKIYLQKETIFTQIVVIQHLKGSFMYKKC